MWFSRFKKLLMLRKMFKQKWHWRFQSYFLELSQNKRLVEFLGFWYTTLEKCWRQQNWSELEFFSFSRAGGTSQKDKNLVGRPPLAISGTTTGDWLATIGRFTGRGGTRSLKSLLQSF